jgi:hypothetical protein
MNRSHSIAGFLRAADRVAAFEIPSAHSETCLNGCHSKLSSGSTSLDASRNFSVLNATKKIAKVEDETDDHHEPAGS